MLAFFISSLFILFFVTVLTRTTAATHAAIDAIMRHVKNTTKVGDALLSLSGVAGFEGSVLSVLSSGSEPGITHLVLFLEITKPLLHLHLQSDPPLS